LPLIVLAAVGAFAASTIMRTLIHNPQPQKRTRETRQHMRQIKELRKIKEEYLKAQGSEDHEKRNAANC